MKYLFYLLVPLLFLGCSSSETRSTLSKTSEPFRVSLALSAPNVLTVPVSAKLILDINETLDPSSVDANTIYIQNSLGEHHPLTVTYNDQQIILVPLRYFDGLTSYEIIITPQVTTTKSRHLSQNKIIPFETSNTIDTTPPQFVTTLPQNNANYIPAYTMIYIQFDEAISPTLSTSAVKLYDASGTYYSGTLKVLGNLIEFHPDTNLTLGSSPINYTVELNTSTLQDLSGNYFSGTSLLSFNFLTENTAELTNVKHPDLTPYASYQTHDHINNLKISSDRLYLASDEGMSILSYDLFSPTKTGIQSLSHLDQNVVGKVYDIHFSADDNRTAYLATSKGIAIVDVTNVRQPKLLSTFSTAYPVYSISIKDTTLYCADTLEGLLSLDVNDPKNPTKLTTLNQTPLVDVHLFYYSSDSYMVLSRYNKDLSLYNLQTQTIDVNISIPGNIHQTTLDPSVSGSIYISSGIGGVVKWEPFPSSTAYAIQAAGRVGKIEVTASQGIANIKHIGLFLFTNGMSINAYWMFDFKVQTFTQVSDGATDGAGLIIADDTGMLYSYIIPTT